MRAVAVALLVFLSFEGSLCSVSSAVATGDAYTRAVLAPKLDHPLTELAMPPSLATDPRASAYTRRFYSFIQNKVGAGDIKVDSKLGDSKETIVFATGFACLGVLLIVTLVFRWWKSSADKAIGRRSRSASVNPLANPMVERLAQRARMARQNKKLPEVFKCFMTQSSVTIVMCILVAGMKYSAEELGMDVGVSYMIFSQGVGTILNMIGEIFLTGAFLGSGPKSGSILVVMLKYLLIAGMDTFVSLCMLMAWVFWFTNGYKTRATSGLSIGLGILSNALAFVGYISYMRADWALPDDDATNAISLPKGFYTKREVIWWIIWLIVLGAGIGVYFAVGRDTQRFMVENGCVNDYNSMVKAGKKTGCDIYTAAEMRPCISFCDKGALSLGSGNEPICTELKAILKSNGGKCAGGDTTLYTVGLAVSIVLSITALVIFYFAGVHLFHERRVEHVDMTMDVMAQSGAIRDRKRRGSGHRMSQIMNMDTPPHLRALSAPSRITHPVTTTTATTLPSGNPSMIPHSQTMH